jgi:hypothetical protein
MKGERNLMNERIIDNPEKIEGNEENKESEVIEFEITPEMTCLPDRQVEESKNGKGDEEENEQ